MQRGNHYGEDYNWCNAVFGENILLPIKQYVKNVKMYEYGRLFKRVVKLPLGLEDEKAITSA